MKDHYDICVTGFWYGYNYGSLLSGYAEYRLLKDMGKEVLMLQKPGAKEDDPEITSGPNTRFIKKYYDENDISPALPFDKLEELNGVCDCFCAGSDQVWNYALSFNESMYLPFADGDKKIISFASSFGHKIDPIPAEAKNMVKTLFERFNAISVREVFDLEILENNFGVKGTLLFEPVFCLDREIYENLAAESTFVEDQPYMLAYVVDPTPEEREAILYYAKALEMKAFIVLDGSVPDWEQNRQLMDLSNDIIENVGVEDFLKIYMNSSFVLTDSFHGAAFSIIFNKSFLCIGNYGRGIDCFLDLFERLKLKDRLVSNPTNIPLDEKYLQPINYEEINLVIAEETQKTVDWLRWAVETPISDFPQIILKKYEPEVVRNKLVVDEYGLRITKNIFDYLEQVSKLKESLVIISIKDTAGLWFNDALQEKMAHLGLKENLVKKFRVGYIAIIYNNAPVYEEIASDSSIVEYETKIEDLDISVTSRPFGSGNEAVIRINGIDYATNHRGLNIVTYDLKDHELIDSVAFDTHEKELTCHRKINYLEDHYDIGIVGVWKGWNYGSVLNGYAVYKTLKKMNRSVLLIHDGICKKVKLNSFVTHTDRFIENFYPKEDISPIIPYPKLNLLNEYCDMFLSGSDQIWNYHLNKGSHMAYMLNFADDSKKKLSFSTSFGMEKSNTPIEEVPKVEELLSRYHAISVREESGVDICRDVYGLKAKAVIEPVFCLTAEEYSEIAEESKMELPEQPYILSYILDPTKEKRQAILDYESISGMVSVNVLDGDPRGYEKNKEILNLPNTLGEIGEEDLVYLYQNASFIISDSFHGAAFALIFNKPFLSIVNLARGKVRFYEILRKFDLIDRLATDPVNIPVQESFLDPIDYTKINEKISEERTNAIEWLRWAIESPVESLPAVKTSLSKLEKDVNALNENADFRKIRILVTLLRDYGVKNIVLSPGGRDVPIVRMFEYNEKHFILHRVTDERSAAYYGMGIAAQLRQPVACVCTSGTAVSNYLPAVTEAYYTGIPLILISSDRKEIYLNQGEDQTIPQKNLFNGVIKKEITIPEASDSQAEYQARRDISECILETTHNGFGPVHINITVNNITLGSSVPRKNWEIGEKIYPHILRVGYYSGDKRMMDWVNVLIKSQRILIVYGQNAILSQEEKNNVELFASKYNCAIVTDHISNLDCAYSIKPHNMLQSISQEVFNRELSPDILITVGGKRLMNDPLTFKIRGGKKNIRHWSVTPDGKIKDFYFRLTSVIEMSQDSFFNWFSHNAGDIHNNGIYFGKWKDLNEQYHSPKITKFTANYIQSKFLPMIPSNSMLHLGVGQSFYDCRKYEIDKTVDVFCNMGTNGIDGCTSTFMGQCSVIKDRLCFLLVGDLSFFYDMNSIWNKPLNNNIRILLVNNNGTGLLRGHQLKAITASHNTKAEGWVKSTGFEYISANTKEEFDGKIGYFVSEDAKKALFFEVMCE